MALTVLEQKLINILKGMVEVQRQLIWLLNKSRKLSDAQIVLNATEILKHRIGLSIKTTIHRSSDIERLLGRKRLPDGLGGQIDVARALNILDEEQAHKGPSERIRSRQESGYVE